MIQNKSMSRAAKKRFVTYYFDLSSAAERKIVIFDPENPILLHRAELVYTVVTSADAQTEGITMGTTASAASYMAAMVPATATAAGTVTAATLLKKFIPANTPIIICRDALTGGANTGEVAFIAWYEILDRSPKK